MDSLVSDSPVLCESPSIFTGLDRDGMWSLDWPVLGSPVLCESLSIFTGLERDDSTLLPSGVEESGSENCGFEYFQMLTGFEIS